MSESTSSEFIQRWQASAGAERANYQLFLSELCDLLAVPRPDPTGTAADDYVFERAVTIPSPDGTTRHGRIDLYKRGCFVCETKQGTEARRNEARPEADLLPAATTTRRGHGIRGTKAWDDAMIAARGQAEQYVRALPDDNPPFIVVMDVGSPSSSTPTFARRYGD